jgi:hypothetical protein
MPKLYFEFFFFPLTFNILWIQLVFYLSFYLKYGIKICQNLLIFLPFDRDLAFPSECFLFHHFEWGINHIFTKEWIL